MSHSNPLASQPPQALAPPPYSHMLIAGDGPNVEFDEELGSYMGIPAMSNRDDSFFSGERCGTPPRQCCGVTFEQGHACWSEHRLQVAVC
jgi:hypothetical protein